MDTSEESRSEPVASSLAAPIEVQRPTADALVTQTAGLVFVTTGTVACHQLGEWPNQIALTPVVALRIAEILRVILQYPDLATREAIVAEWQAGEAASVPHGRVRIDAGAVHVGIEPLGAGTYVSVLWPHVPVFTLQLDQVARGLQRTGSLGV